MRERQFKNPAYWPAIPFDESDISEKPTLKMVKVKPEEFFTKASQALVARDYAGDACLR